jgi:hypothetical protein
MSERLVDKLRRLRDLAPTHAMKLAQEHANLYITKTIEKIVLDAVQAASVHGYDNIHIWADTVMTHGNLIKAETVYDRVVEELKDEGLQATWNLDHTPRTNIRKVLYTISWKDAK